MLAARYGHEGIVKQLLARTDIQVNLVNDQGWSALMLAAFHGYTSIVIQVLATPEVLVNSINNEGRSALMLAAQGGHEATVGLLLAVTYIDTAIRSATDGHTAMSLALAKGHTRIVQLLQEFDSRSDSDRPSAMDLTLDEVVHPGQLVSDMPFDQETGSECELDELQGIDEFQSSVGDAKMDVDASGPDDNRMQDELSGLGKGIKRYRDEDDSLHGAILDMGAAPEPAHKRRRSAQVP
ncbi:ankyrin repeat-containing domain protein [Coprinopsis sp. MPI-PUGE-AT-0042]|nr:ankyrin repeat-containing domain protein [Coprinopsis sp. MPI-PUGE-AT-0042]